MSMQPRRRHNWIFADTSGYYGAAAENDDNHAAARAILSRLERERIRFFTTHYVLAELHALIITRRRNPQFALAVLRSTEAGSATVVPVTAADHAQARDLLAQHQDKLYSLTDALSFVVMERIGIIRVFTFDHNFEQHRFELVTP